MTYLADELLLSAGLADELRLDAELRDDFMTTSGKLSAEYEGYTGIGLHSSALLSQPGNSYIK